MTSSSSGITPSNSADKNLADVFDRHHVAALDHLGADAVDDQAQRHPALGQLSDDAVGVANRAHLRRRHDDRFACAGERVAEPVLDAGRAVDQNELGHLRQLVDDFDHRFLADRRLLARLGGRKHRERFEALVADQRLAQLAAALDDFDQVEDDALLDAEHEVEVAQADVGIDQHDAAAALSQRRAEVGGRRRLADSAFARGDDDAARAHRRGSSGGIRRDRDALAFDEGHLGFARGAPPLVGGDRSRDAQLGRRELERDDARGEVALRAGVRGSAQRAEDQDVAGRDELGARD